MMVSLLDEVQDASFGDKRLNKRLGIVIEELGAKPNLSIPAATNARAEMEAAYRFLDNDKVSPEKILKPHFAATRERISQTDFALLVQDTTELDLTRPKQQVQGAGFMDCQARRGAFFHPLEAFDLDGLPLGMVWQKTWIREAIETETTKQEKHQKRRKTPIEQKESIRWIEGIRAARDVAEACPATTCVCVGDSEADVYELFSESRGTTTNEVHLLVRGGQTRSAIDQSNWLEKVRAATVTLDPPDRFDRQLPEVTVNVVLVEETNPPAGCDAIARLLITTLPINTSKQVQRIVRAYCVRWQIEIFFRTIKSGCRIEERQFETLDRVLNCVAVYSIVAWRVMYLCRLGRECPDLNCEVVFEPCEWKAVYMAVKRTEPPATPLRLNEIIRMIASLGGYVDRQSTQPGPQTLWIGLQRVHDLSTAWNAFGPDS